MSCQSFTIALLCAAAFTGLLTCQQVNALVADDLTPEEIREALLDQNYDPGPFDLNAREPWHALMELDTETQVAILQDIVEEGNQRMAAAAVRMLMYNHRNQVVEVQDLIVQRIPDFPDDFETSTLRNVLQYLKPTEWLPLARHILQRHMTEAIPYERDDRLLGAVDLAAQVLLVSEEQDDRQLIQEAVIAFSESPELWIALARMGALELPHQALGLTMYMDEEFSTELRTAVAVALAPNVPDAAQQAKELIESTIDDYGAFDLELAIAKLAQGGPDYTDDEDVQLYLQRHIAHRIIAMAGALPPEEAKQLLNQAFAVENNELRLHAAGVAAEAQPEWMIEHNLQSLTDSQRNAMLALLAHLHPEHEEAARNRSTDTEAFDEILERMDEVGMTTAYVELGL